MVFLCKFGGGGGVFVRFLFFKEHLNLRSKGKL